MPKGIHLRRKVKEKIAQCLMKGRGEEEAQMRSLLGCLSSRRQC
jgi:hypothetical protein